MKEYDYECLHDDILYKIFVGENSQDNWDVIDMGKQDDYWFHVDDIPSCHVVLIRENNKKPHRTVMKYCAILCKNGSKANNIRNTKIIYTEIKNVKKCDSPGTVITKNTRIIKI